MSFPLRRRLPTSSCLALWLLAIVLAMKAALPMLAAVSAGLQDKTVAEVCPVYGVQTVALVSSTGDDAQGADHEAASHHGHPHPSGHDGGGPHRGEHCALGALPAFAGAAEAGIAPPPASADAGRPVASPAAALLRPDAAARWAGLIGHGPPAFT